MRLYVYLDEKRFLGKVIRLQNNELCMKYGALTSHFFYIQGGRNENN